MSKLHNVKGFSRPPQTVAWGLMRIEHKNTENPQVKGIQIQSKACNSSIVTLSAMLTVNS